MKFLKLPQVSLIGLLIILMLIWTRGGFQTIYFDTDLARDLTQLSNIWLKRIVWLGPWLNFGFNTSPIYYYLFYPFLWISGGNAQAIIIGNVIFAALALWWFGSLGLGKWGKITLVAVALIGVSVWWQKIAFHPGNGFTYTIWIFLTITGLYFEIPIFWSSLFLGIASAFHPSSFVVLPILLYEWFRRKNLFKNFLYIMAGLLIPWFPIILFEFITHGFLIRQFLSNSSIGLHLNFSFNTLQQIATLSGLNFYILIIAWIVITIISKGRIKTWSFLFSIILLLLSFGSNLQLHYLFGTICVMWFISIVVSIQYRFGSVALILALLFFTVSTLSHPPIPATRTITQIDTLVNSLLNTQILEKKQKIAVVAALPAGTGTPQADDYRFFLRIKGYNVLDVPQYSQADTLVLFIEQPNFDFKNWSTWEIEQFGKRKLIKNLNINGVEAVIFSKEP